MPETAHSPLLRNAVHASVFFIVGLPLLLVARIRLIPHFEYWAAGLMALITIANLLILPRLEWGKKIRREDEAAYNGVWLYPASIGACFLTFPTYAVFAAWAVLACGDSAASLFGRTFGGPKLPWNPKKSLAGLIGFILCACAGAYLSLWLLPSPLFLKADGSPELPYVWTLALLAAAAGALVESLDTELDDNIRVPFAAAGAILLTAFFLNYSTRSLPATTHVQPERLIHALIANALLGALVLACGFASLAGTLLGMLIGVLIFFYAHWQGFLLLTLFVGIGSALSKFGLQRKREDQTAEANEGRRGVGNVAANLLVPALCCILYPLSGGRASLLIAFAGSIAAAMADTASSEIGVLSPAQPYLITTFKRVPHGTNGAVSWLGTLGACAGAALIAVTACLSGFVQIAAGMPLSDLTLIAAGCDLLAAGMCGTMIDSLLGATIEARLAAAGKGVVNFACTFAGAMLAGFATELWMYFAR